MKSRTHFLKEKTFKVFLNQRGFMSSGGHAIGAILLALSLVLISPFILKWLGNWGWPVLATIFIPLFVLTHFIADIISKNIFK